jgi:hypothetical protein
MIPGSIKRYKSLRQTSLALLMIFILSASWVPVAGQTTQPEVPPLKDRLFYGGNLNLQFGTYTDIQVSPVIGLWVLPRLGIAIGPDFQYYKLGSTRTFIYGGKTYLEYLFLQDLDNVIPIGMHVGLFLHTEYELLSLESSFFKDPPYDSDRFLAGTLLAGGGVRQQLGKRSSLNMTFLWTLNSDAYRIYGNPEIRISFIF